MTSSEISVCLVQKHLLSCHEYQNSLFDWKVKMDEPGTVRAPMLPIAMVLSSRKLF